MATVPPNWFSSVFGVITVAIAFITVTTEYGSLAVRSAIATSHVVCDADENDSHADAHSACDAGFSCACDASGNPYGDAHARSYATHFLAVWWVRWWSDV